jgi:hypothetical protein
MSKRIGEFLIERKLLTPSQRSEILAYSREHGLRFGDAALELGLLKRSELIQLFGPSFRTNFFYLDPLRFPVQTADLLTAEEIAEWGVLPLGSKTGWGFFRSRRQVNLGCVDPRETSLHEKAMTRILERAHARSFSIQRDPKIYLVLADQVLKVLKQVYGLSIETLRDSGRIHPLLQE